MEFALPAPVLDALERVNARGYEAYAVGGCVRDLLRGVTPHDYDICVSCPPEETHACFAGERVIDTGVKHGTVTVLLRGMALEITTFRADGDYADGRHPSSVRFTRSLEEDLKRRDFTVNAMAYHPATGVVDLFDGQGDLKAGVLRCVGDAPTRLTEDALRILRAVRFAAQLDFIIEPQTAQAMRALSGRLSLVSRERIAEELLRALRAPAAARVLPDYPEVLTAALPDYPAQALSAGAKALSRLPGGDEALGLAALLHGCAAEDRQACLRSLRLSKALENSAAQLAALALRPWPLEDTPLLLAQLGREQAERLLLLQQACGAMSAGEAAMRSSGIKQTIADGLPLRLRDLPVTGDDLKALGFSGPAIGEALNELQRMALQGAIPCQREAMLQWLMQKKKQ
ncbi:MAG: polynucleotide adenylyltransferase [Clostridia bacterium]|nr:polynucleotide adenylyltransferase [Clostridia bacterium]